MICSLNVVRKDPLLAWSIALTLQLPYLEQSGPVHSITSLYLLSSSTRSQALGVLPTSVPMFTFLLFRPKPDAAF